MSAAATRQDSGFAVSATRNGIGAGKAALGGTVLGIALYALISGLEPGPGRSVWWFLVFPPYQLIVCLGDWADRYRIQVLVHVCVLLMWWPPFVYALYGASLAAGKSRRRGHTALWAVILGHYVSLAWAWRCMKPRFALIDQNMLSLVVVGGVYIAMHVWAYAWVRDKPAAVVE